MNNYPEQNQKNKKTRAVYFISDAHLPMHKSENEKRLVRFLQFITNDATALYILGDLFDFWFEYKHAIPAAYLETLSALLNLSKQGVKVTYIPGNHDFWLGDYLHNQANLTLAADCLEVEHQGRKIHLTHGDGLDPGDTGYRFIKRIFRNRLNIRLYRLLPVDWAYWLALRTSQASRNYTSQKTGNLQGYYNYAEIRLKSGADAVIMGHTHRPEKKALANGEYINCGDWLTYFSYVVLRNGEFELQYYTDNNA